MNEDDGGNDLIGLSERPIKDVEKLRLAVLKLFDRDELKNPYLINTLNDIHGLIDFRMQCEEFMSLGLTKPQKAAARSFAVALRRVEITLKSVEVPGFYLRGFPRAEIKKWRALFEGFSIYKSGKHTRLNAMKKRLAITEAYKLGGFKIELQQPVI